MATDGLRARLCTAAFRGDVEEVRRLVDKVSPDDDLNDDHTLDQTRTRNPIHFLCLQPEIKGSRIQRYEETLRILLESGWRYQKNRKNLFAIRVENQILAQKLEGEKRAQLILDHLDLRG